MKKRKIVELFEQKTKLTSSSKDDFIKHLRRLIPSNVESVCFFCVGTDRSTGDSLGPLVGTFLTEKGYTNVIGTLDDTVHAMNITEKMALIPKGAKVIALDSALGNTSSVGDYCVAATSLKPGTGVNKELPRVGDYSITGVVNVGGFMEYFVLQNTRLSLVMKMAKDIADALSEVLPLEHFGSTASPSEAAAE